MSILFEWRLVSFVLHIDNTPSALSLSDQPEEISIQPQEAVEGDNVTLTCRAARYLYTDLRWLDSLNRTVTSDVSPLQLSRYSISLSLQLYNVTKTSAAGFKCQPYKQHRRVELKSAALIIEGNQGLIAADWKQGFPELYSQSPHVSR